MVDYTCRGLSSLPAHHNHTRSPFGGKFRGFAANLDAFMVTCRFFGEVGDHFLSLRSQVPALTPNHGKAKRVHREGTKSPQIVSSS